MGFFMMDFLYRPYEGFFQAGWQLSRTGTVIAFCENPPTALETPTRGGG
jgi:hypothetical protein